MHVAIVAAVWITRGGVGLQIQNTKVGAHWSIKPGQYWTPGFYRRKGWSGWKSRGQFHFYIARDEPEMW